MNTNILGTIDPTVLGKHLKDAREDAGISIEEASKHLETADAHIFCLEDGITRITPYELRELASLYNTQMCLLINGPRRYTDEEALEAYCKNEMSIGMLAHFLKVDHVEAIKRVQKHWGEVELEM